MVPDLPPADFHLYYSHIDAISKNPRVDVEKVLKTRYLHEFDRYYYPADLLNLNTIWSKAKS